MKIKENEIEFSYVDERPNDVMLTKADINAMKNLGWQAKKDFQRLKTKAMSSSSAPSIRHFSQQGIRLVTLHSSA